MNYNQQPPTQGDPNERTYSAIGCFWLLFLVPLIAGKGSELCKHYANYGFILFVVVAIFAIMSSIFAHVLVLGLLFGFIYGIVGLASLIAAILGCLSAQKGEYIKVPVLTDIKIFK